MMRPAILAAFLLANVCLAAAPPSIAPRRPEVPVSALGEAANPIDRFVDVYFEKHDIAWPPVVPDAVFARRAYLDLWGLLPTPEQLQEFLTDTRRDKRARLVEHLFANWRNYSEHWITFWNDLLRNDEGVVYHGARQSITKWLLKALADNMPYDQFVAALLNPARPDDPSGFLLGVTWRGTVSASQAPPLQAAQNSAQVFLGVNLKCNSCHDSFISRWKLKDAYGLASFFSPDQLEIYRCDVKTGEKSQAQFLYPELGAVAPDASLAERRTAAARLFTDRENGRFARTFVNRIWDRLLGRGLVASVDDMDQGAWDPDLLDWLASDFVDHHYDIQFLLERVMTSRSYQLPAVPEASRPVKDYIFRGPSLRRLTAEQFVDAVSSITGEWRVLQPQQAGAGTYAREWRLKSSPLTRALGRPIRDQVFTQRNSEATTLQALEVVNGGTLHNLLRRGAKRMLGQLRPPPENRFDSGVVSSNVEKVDIDISGARQLWLLLADADSYDPSRTVAGWANAELAGPGGRTPLADLKPAQATARMLHFKKQEPAEGMSAPLNSELVYEIAGRGFTRFRATVGIDESCFKNDISPRVRFFIFKEEPDRDRLVRVAGDPPVPVSNENVTVESLTTRLYRHALARDPRAEERSIAGEFLTPQLSPGGLEDLLWSIFLSPEFQYIQ